MKHNRLLRLVCLCITWLLVSSLQAQYTQLDGVKICLDPGHGGHDSNDRPTELGVGTIYYESDANWEAVGFLDSLLQKLGADVKITKTTNDPDSPDREPSLSDRVQVANTFGADYFHSFHTNGVDNPTVNYTLVLYAGVADNQPDDPDALVMAEIQDDELFKYMKTTTHFARADIPFTGFTNGLGVLNNLNMPGTLSECSFHSNLNEGRRLMNSRYRKAAAWALVKSFLAYYDQPALDVGEIGGIVTDKEGQALNDIVVTLNPGTDQENIYNGDQFLNGYYLFDWLAPGDYEIKYERQGYDPQLRTITVVAGEYTEVDVSLNEEGSAPSIPTISFVSNPLGQAGVEANWIPNAELTLKGYRLYFATDDNLDNWTLAADESRLTSDSTSVSLPLTEFANAPTSDVYHFKLTAVAESEAESEGGDIYSRSSIVGGDRILIVDGFDRTSGSFTEKYHEFATDYFKSIRDSRVAEVATASNEAVIMEDVQLSDYDLVVWFLGDESTSDETLNSTEQSKIANFLEDGGKLFISGSEIGWDLSQRGTSDDKTFYETYLKAIYVADGAQAYNPAKGIAGTEFEGLEIPFGIAYPEDFPDDIAPGPGAIAILDYNEFGKRGGVAYKGNLGAGVVPGGVVYISFPLETAGVRDRQLMMRMTLDYLEVGTYQAWPPIAEDDESQTSSDQAVSIDVLDNDWDLNNDLNPASISIDTNPTNGSAVVAGSQIQYTPDIDFGGDDTFTYQVKNSDDLASNLATVTVSVEKILGIESGSEQMVLVPNPIVNDASLRLRGKEFKSDLHVVISDLNGRHINAMQFPGPTSGILRLPTSSLKTGIYLLSVSSDQRTEILKLIKK
ncbi:MAG: N-acetylmuramoyl-L-alanine amidase [Cyclobacteriaceae bacterium]|nr:N-acetylmuramoyl-L-alanine amidase [Cyclobacteriaceae bacterium HetDA_MAG_MS6]